jgi:putative phosphoesterase
LWEIPPPGRFSDLPPLAGGAPGERVLGHAGSGIMALMIGILSDTHDNVDAIRQAVRIFQNAACSLIIHAGDFVAPFAARELGAAGIPVQAVYGNCDGEKHGLAEAIKPFGTIQEPPLVLQIEGRSVLVVHKDMDVRKLIRAAGQSIIIFGHTHRSEVRRAGRTLLVNPGEVGGWVTGLRTVALLDPATLAAEILPL